MIPDTCSKRNEIPSSLGGDLSVIRPSRSNALTHAHYAVRLEYHKKNEKICAQV